MIVSRWQGWALAAGLVALAGCDASAGQAVDRTVTLAWDANHERGVNGPGGGYRLAIPGRVPVDVPWPEPRSVTTVLRSGRHAVTVQAYEPDPTGAGVLWSPAASFPVVVP